MAPPLGVRANLIYACPVSATTFMFGWGRALKSLSFLLQRSKLRTLERREAVTCENFNDEIRTTCISITTRWNCTSAKTVKHEMEMAGFTTAWVRLRQTVKIDTHVKKTTVRGKDRETSRSLVGLKPYSRLFKEFMYIKEVSPIRFIDILMRSFSIEQPEQDCYWTPRGFWVCENFYHWE